MKEQEIHSFGEAFNGKTPSKTEQCADGQPILKIKDIDENGQFRGIFESFVDSTFYNRHSKKRLKTNDTIILNAAHNSNYVGSKNAYVSSRLNGVIPTGEWLVVRVNEADPAYVNHFLKSPLGRKRLKNCVKGIHLYPKDVERIKIPLPSLDEQKRIAHLLNKLEGLIAQRKQNLQELDDLLKSVFLSMFGFCDGSVSKWKKDLLVKYSDIVSGVTKGKKYNEKLFATPYMRVANVQDGYFDFSEVKTIAVSKKEIQQYQLLKGDLLLTEGGDPDKLGRGFVWEGEIKNCIHQNHIFRVRLKESSTFNPYFLSALIGSKYGKTYFLKSAKQTTGIASVNSTQLKNFPVLIPPLSLQNEFSAIIKKVEILKFKYQTSLTDLKQLYGTLSQKAFRDELDLSRISLPLDKEESQDTLPLQELELGLEKCIPSFKLPHPNNLLVLNTPEGRREYLKLCFDAYLAQVREKPAQPIHVLLSDIQTHFFNFHEEVETQLNNLEAEEKEKISDCLNTFALSILPADYEILKTLLFQALEQGKLKQGYQDNTNSLQLVAARG